MEFRSRLGKTQPYEIFHVINDGSYSAKKLLELGSLTGFSQLSKTTILPKLKQFLSTVGPIFDHVEYLVGLGFKDLFACMLIVIAYLFVMKIPQPTGAQGLRGIIVAESEVPDPPNGMVVGQGPPDQGQFAMLLAMMAESQRNVLSPVLSTNYVVTIGL